MAVVPPAPVRRVTSPNDGTQSAPWLLDRTIIVNKVFL